MYLFASYRAVGSHSHQFALNLGHFDKFRPFSMSLLAINQTLINDEALFYSQHTARLIPGLLEHPDLFIQLEGSRRGRR